MLCDELKEYTNPTYGSSYYDIDEVDAAIAELKAELAENNKDIAYWREEYDRETKLTDALKAEIESLKASHYAESVDAGMRERKLKRALWLARAERANEIHFMWCQLIYDLKYGIVKFNVKKEWGENTKPRQMLHTPQGWADVWDDVERKCRAKAEEYK